MNAAALAAQRSQLRTRTSAFLCAGNSSAWIRPSTRPLGRSGERSAERKCFARRARTLLAQAEFAEQAALVAPPREHSARRTAI